MLSTKSLDRYGAYIGPMVTLAVVTMVESGHHLGFTIPNPQLFAALAITYSAYVSGYRGGLLSAAIGVAYAVHFFSVPGELFTYKAGSLEKVLVNSITLPMIDILVSKLN
jgi:K+-sensing histidine kinase KdpD